MAQPNYFSMQEMGDNLWRDYMNYRATNALNLEREQADHITLLQNMVYNDAPAYSGKEVGVFPQGHSRSGQPMTDWEYLHMELDNASDIYCMGIDCMDPGQDAAAKTIGFFKRAYDRIEGVHLDTQDWLEKSLGDPVKDESGEMIGGWMKRISAAQQNFGGKFGTEDASAVYDDMVKFREDKDLTLTKESLGELDQAIDYLKEWSQQESIMKMFDMPSEDGVYNDEILNYIKKGEPGFEENANLFFAIERMRMGQIDDAKQFHNTWVAAYDKRRLADIEIEREVTKREKQRLTDADTARRLKWADSHQRAKGKIETLGRLELESATLGGFSNEFVPRYWMQEYNVDTGSVGADGRPSGWNITSAKDARDMLASNLAGWMDDYAEGDFKDDWDDMMEAMTIANPQYGQKDREVAAANQFFNSYTLAELKKKSEGRTGPGWLFGWGEGLDFPGTGTEETQAERYFNATVDAWNEMNTTVNDPELLILPEGSDSPCPPGDPFCAGDTKVEYEDPFFFKASKIPGVDALHWDQYEQTNRLNFDPDVNLTADDRDLLNTLVATADTPSELMGWLQEIRDEGMLSSLDTLNMEFTGPENASPMINLSRLLEPAMQDTVRELVDVGEVKLDSSKISTSVAANIDAATMGNDLQYIHDTVTRHPAAFKDYGVNEGIQVKNLYQDLLESGDTWDNVSEFMTSILGQQIPVEPEIYLKIPVEPDTLNQGE